jgi:quinoprotein glucose dehydrogenase
LRSLRLVLLASVCLPACGTSPLDHGGPTAEWSAFAGGKGGPRYSTLTQINRDNVDELELVWEHRSGDFHVGDAEHAGTSFQASPVITNGLLYYCTPFQRVFALDPETGQERWSFDPELQGRAPEGPYPLNCRGVSYWEASDAREGVACQRRIVYGTRDSELIALDADTGKPCEEFGDGGRVQLREGLDPNAPDWEYYPTSPPIIVGDIAVLGALVADQLRTDAPSGVVRAFDVKTGRRVWAWDPVPPDWRGRILRGERYSRGTPNVWSILSADEERGLVFLPTGNPAPDSFGGVREGLDYYGSSVVAVSLKKGELVWHYQTVHHDIWDYDVPAQPQLFQIPGVGAGRPGIAQPTKMGFLFLLDRETGKPLYPVEERPVPQGGEVAGEVLSPTQPFPTHPAPLHPEQIEPWGFTPYDRAACKELLSDYRWDGFYTPPTAEGSLQFPHTSGGMNWGGVAIDPERALLITNQTHVVHATKLVSREEYDRIDPSTIVYPIEAYPMAGTPYGLRRFTPLSPFGAPCNKPPWGTLKAVDLRSGEIVWERPLGTTRDAAPFPIWVELGVPNFGGGITTASGVYFIGATMDRYFRAFDAETGAELWRKRIPYSGNSIPATYRLREDGRQFVVLAAGGNPVTGAGDALLAYALPGRD